MVDVAHLRAHYDQLNDDELRRIAKTDLVPEARAVLEQEIVSRGLAESIDALSETAPPSRPSRNPYASPKTPIADPDAWATVKVSGLIRLFQIMVVISTLIGIFQVTWFYLPIPVDETLRAYRMEAGAGAIAPQLAYLVGMAMQLLWILSAFGLCFFKWWGRPVFAGTYVLGFVVTMLGGIVIALPWEEVLATVAKLLDGAVLALAFLPPLSTYFDRDRGS